MAIGWDDVHLPFKEWDKAVKELKKLYDNSSPKYPLEIWAEDSTGRKLCRVVYANPRSRPEVDVVLAGGEQWDSPVRVVIEDAMGCQTSKDFEKVTPGVVYTVFVNQPFNFDDPN